MVSYQYSTDGFFPKCAPKKIRDKRKNDYSHDQHHARTRELTTNLVPGQIA